MQILALITIDDEHQFSQVNELYDRLHGFRAKLAPVPECKDDNYGLDHYANGWNDCIEEIMREDE